MQRGVTGRCNTITVIARKLNNCIKIDKKEKKLPVSLSNKIPTVFQ